MFRNTILRIPCAFPKVRYLSSSAPSPGLNDSSIYSILNPFIDFEQRINDPKLHSSITKRNLRVNLENVSQLWKEYKSIEQDKIKLEKSKNEIQEKIKSFSDPIKNEKEISGLKLVGKVIRQDLKNISSSLTNIEEILLQQVIKLPSDLCEELFPDETISFFIPSPKTLSHLDIGKKLDLLDYFSQTSFFLKKEAAQLELDISSYILNVFCSNEFIPFSNPDFSRSLIIEGTCANPNSLIKLTKDKRADDLFLNGSASLYPFCSYHTKVISDRIPIRYVAQGRHYEPHDFENGLYSVWQSSAVQIFIASSESGIVEEFEKAVRLMTQIYKEVGLHFRIVRTPASELELFEGLRLSFQVHSPFSDKYYEAGNLSFHSDYLSKRLRMYYKDNDSRRFLHVISGTVVKVPPILASLLESTQGCKLSTFSVS